jgi:hypothetical protein
MSDDAIIAALARIERKQSIYERVVNLILGSLENQTRMLAEIHAALAAPARPSETAETLKAILAELQAQSGLLHEAPAKPEC